MVPVPVETPESSRCRHAHFTCDFKIPPENQEKKKPQEKEAEGGEDHTCNNIYHTNNNPLFARQVQPYMVNPPRMQEHILAPDHLKACSILLVHTVKRTP